MKFLVDAGWRNSKKVGREAEWTRLCLRADGKNLQSEDHGTDYIDLDVGQAVEKTVAYECI